MPKRHDKITKSVNYDYYWDILFCTVPLLAVSCFYYGARPLLMMAAGLLTAYVADCVVTPLHAAGYRAHEPSSEAFAALIVLMMPASAPYYMGHGNDHCRACQRSVRRRGALSLPPGGGGIGGGNAGMAAGHVVLPGTGYSAGTFQQHRSGADPRQQHHPVCRRPAV